MSQSANIFFSAVTISISRWPILWQPVSPAQGRKIDGFQLQALWNNCRLAKEKLLDPESKADEVPVTILGKGSSLIGATIKANLHREQVEQVLDGFLPAAASTDMPQHGRRAGLQEMGLPYAADPAITRHLARFLRQQASSSEHGVRCVAARAASRARLTSSSTEGCCMRVSSATVCSACSTPGFRTRATTP